MQQFLRKMLQPFSLATFQKNATKKVVTQQKISKM
jgi:hypothetical protein